MFQTHHILANKFADHPVIKFLGELFNPDGVGNLMKLPSDQGVASDFGSSPHTGGHLETYYAGFERFLGDVFRSSNFSAAGAGDQAARDQISSDLNSFVAVAKYALANKHLFANTPTGMTPKEAAEVNETWFKKLAGLC